MMGVLTYLRNLMESSGWFNGVLDKICSNDWYKRIVYHQLRKRVDKTNADKMYTIAVEVSSLCNAKCSFCPNSFMKRKKGIMTMEVFNKMVERIENEGIQPKQFNLTGTGEPLLDKDLFEKIDILKSKFPTAEVFFPTNFCLATNEVIEKIVNSKLDFISISLNADNKKDYFKIMKLDYERTIANLERLLEVRGAKRKELRIYLSVAANPINKMTIDGFVKKWRPLVDGININWVHSWAGAVEDIGITKSSAPKYPCRSLFEQIVVQSNGDIPLCCVDYEGTYVGGNVVDTAILSAVGDGVIGKIKNKHLDGKIRDTKMCADCRFSDRGLYWFA